MIEKPTLIKSYIKSSTDEELFYDMIDKIQELKEQISEIYSSIPEAKNGEDGKDGKDGKNGKTPSESELREIIIPLITDPKNGKDGSPDTAEQVRDKIKSLKGNSKLSVFDLKDYEWINKKGNTNSQVQWSSAGFKVYTDATLTGDGSYNNPLHAVSQTSSLGAVINATNSGDNQNYDLAEAATSSQYYIIMNNAVYTTDDASFPFSVSGFLLTFQSALPSDLASTIIKLICV